ncbi:MAG: glycosyltransferase family 4 protein [Acetobacteraceae bacterium]|nr:glycosyltransferase family 4 protein [Acetobacteraceae bacterium]
MPRPTAVGRLAYLSMETLLPGRAGYTHVHEIIDGLETLGWEVSRFLARRADNSAPGRPIGRLPEHVRVLSRLIPQLRHHDVLYVRSHPLAWPAAMAAYRAGLTVVHEINGVPEDLGVTYPWLRPMNRQLFLLQTAQYRKAQAIFAVTPGLVSWAHEVAPGLPAYLIPNGANLSLFTPSGPKYIHPKPYVLFVGGLVRWHGIDTILAALRNDAWPPDTYLVVAGDGSEGNALATAEAETPRLVWLRRQEYGAIPSLLRGALAALVPISNPDGRSNHGVLPVKLFEAMACGTPVIVSDLPGQAELVRQIDAGLVIPMDDAPALAKSVALLRQNELLAQRLGKAGAAAAHRAHGWQHRARQVHDVLIGLRTRVPA